jgi:arginase
MYILGFLKFGFHVIKIPYDAGANMRGSRQAPEFLNYNFLGGMNSTIVDIRGDFASIVRDAYATVEDTLQTKRFPVILGGDHSISIASVASVNDYCNNHNKTLGILWCDAHADFNTYENSVSKNMHGMPVAVLCGHTLKNLCSKPLNCDQFAYFGLRDIDSDEFGRLQEHDMTMLHSEADILQWMKKFDCIHVSFDLDCFDAEFVSTCVNTPVANGKNLLEVECCFKVVASKVISFDIVELNPSNIGISDYFYLQTFMKVFTSVFTDKIPIDGPYVSDDH